MSDDDQITQVPEPTELEKAAKRGAVSQIRPLSAEEEARVEQRRRLGLADRPERASKHYDGRALRRHRKLDQNVLHNFYIEVDLPEFKRALDFSKDPKFQMLLVAINNPNLAGCSFPELCKRCNLGINDIASIWRNYQLAQGMIRMMNHMPQVMEDVVEDSKTRIQTCRRCHGRGKVEKGAANKQVDGICPTCHGDGQIRVKGDKDSRKLAFEAAGLLQSAQVNVNTNVNLGALPTLEDELRSAEKVFDITATEEVPNGSGNGGEDKPQEGKEAVEGDQPQTPEDRGEAGDPGDEPADPTDYSA